MDSTRQAERFYDEPGSGGQEVVIKRNTLFISTGMHFDGCLNGTVFFRFQSFYSTEKREGGTTCELVNSQQSIVHIKKQRHWGVAACAFSRLAIVFFPFHVSFSVFLFLHFVLRHVHLLPQFSSTQPSAVLRNFIASVALLVFVVPLVEVDVEDDDGARGEAGQQIPANIVQSRWYQSLRGWQIAVGAS